MSATSIVPTVPVTTELQAVPTVAEIATATEVRAVATSSGEEAITESTDVRNVVIDAKTPKRIYAATDQGVFRSEDAADTWTRIDAGLPTGAIVALVMHPAQLERIYAATSDGRLFRTDDAGASWRALP